VKVLGIIVEYNPFHNGHLYHLKESIKLSGADKVICVMSGNFIQRGEPAIINKWARTKMALSAGIDLVIELPTVYAMASAEYFAFGAVKLLDSLGIVDYLCFGSECGNIHALDRIAEVLSDEPLDYKGFLKQNLSKGLSYARCRELALVQYFNEITIPSSETSALLNNSNNILGIEYLKALKRIKSDILPLTITRKNNDYNSLLLSGSISSATAIRKSIFDNELQMQDNELVNSLPDFSLSTIKDEFTNGRGPIYPEKFSNIILSIIRSSSREHLKSLPYVSEGIENRIKVAAENSGTLEELISNIVTKRYTKTRIQRILFSLATGMSSSEFDSFNKHGGPQYIRVLGFSKKGQDMLSKTKKATTIPIIMKTADFKRSCNPLLRRMLEIEAHATDIYVLGYDNPKFKKAGQEFTLLSRGRFL